ncbi:MAG: PaaI family thioesterase [Edaphobacter sp.]
MNTTPTLDERARNCFGCGPANPQGLHLTFAIDTTNPEAPTATTHVQLTNLHEGPPGYIHGGIVATLLDEAMSKLNRPLNVLAMTRHMEIDYLRPAPLHQSLILISRHLRREGRKLFHQAELQHPNGTVLARGKGLFIIIDEKLLARVGLTRPQV